MQVQNLARGGRSSRTFISEGLWDSLLQKIQPGDIVLIQFGHNDNGARGALKGTGDETIERENATTKKTESVHTFGWNLRQYVAEARSKGATPILCSLIPRNIWKDDKIVRTRDSHSDWTRAVATSEHVDFIDLHELIATEYDALGAKSVMPLFADQRVRTSWAGAVLNAKCVTEGLNELPQNPLAPYYTGSAPEKSR